MYYQKQSIFDGELSQMWKTHRQLVRNQGITTALINLMQQRLDNITNRWRDLYHYRVDYHLRNAYDDTLTATNTNDHPQQSKKTDGFLSNIIISVKHSFNNQQLQFLCRGPSYVPPCQMYISSSYVSVNDVIKRQYAPFFFFFLGSLACSWTGLSSEPVCSCGCQRISEFVYQLFPCLPILC